jgi:hypothetical protein
MPSIGNADTNWLSRRRSSKDLRIGRVFKTGECRSQCNRTNAFVWSGDFEPVEQPPDRLPVLLVVVDTEENFDWNGAYSSSSTAVHGMRRIEKLQSIFDRFGIKPAYMVDYAIASQHAGYGPLIDIVATGRCEIGAHLHPWINPPTVERMCSGNSYPSNLPSTLEAEKLRRLTSIIEANLGIRATSYKAGRYGIGGATPEILIDQGYTVDLSVVPTRDYSADGGPDFRSFHAVRPFWVDKRRRLLEIPSTTALIGGLSGSGAALFNEINGRIGRSLRLPAIFARLGLFNRITLTPEGVTLREAKALTRHLLANGERVFTLAFHSTSLTPGSTPYSKNEKDVAGLYAWLKGYFAFFEGEVAGHSVTPSAFRAAADKPCPFGKQAESQKRRSDDDFPRRFAEL